MPLKNFTADSPLISLDAIRPGAQWTWARLARDEVHQQYYEGDYSALLSGITATAANGLSSIGSAVNDLTPVNWCRVVTDFYIRALFSERPAVTSLAPSRQAFIDDRREEVFAALERASEWRSIKGWGVLMVTSGAGLVAVDSSYYFPLRDEADVHRTIGHVLAYKYRAYDPTETLVNDPRRIANRIRIVRYSEMLGVNDVTTYTLEGGVTIGQPLESAPSDVQGIWSWGRDDQDDYHDIASLILQAAIRLTLSQQALNRNANPHLQGPGPGIDALARDTAGYRRTAMGLLLPVEYNQPPYEWVSWDPGLEAAYEMLRELRESIHTVTGVPRVVFGFAGSGASGGAGESGEARDRLMYSAMARVRTLRREIENILPMVLDAMGAPEGDTTVSWVADPFASVQERTQEVLMMLTSGVISIDEARERFGYMPMPDGMGEPQPREQEQSQE